MIRIYKDLNGLSEALTNFKKGITDKEKVMDAILASAFYMAIIWIVFLLDAFLGWHLKSFGLIPRTAEGLIGIFSMHFLHSNWEHIIHNTMAIAVLNTFLFYFYRKIAVDVVLWVSLIGATFVWFFGRDNNHIGASLLLYGEFSFLFFSGLFRRDPMAMRVALLMALYYGSLIWYIFPIDEKISFEGHFGGFAVGLVLAYVWRKKGPQKKIYRFEVEPELDDSNPFWLTEEQKAERAKESDSTLIEGEKKEESKNEAGHQTTVTIKYTFKPNDPK